MLDPGTESFLTALASPAIVVVIIGYLLKRDRDKQEEAVKSLAAAVQEVSDDLKTEKVTSAVTKSNTDRTLVLVEAIRKDYQDLRDEHTKTRSAVDATWRVLDIKRMS